MPRALLSHDRKYGTGHVQRPEKVGGQLRLELLRRQFLKETGKEIARIVDQYVNARETVESCLNCLFCRRRARDVEFDDEKVVGLSDRLGHGIGAAA